MNKKIKRRQKRHLKIRKIISGTKEKPRLSVFKSNKYLYAQLIDDSRGKVVVSVSEKEIERQGTKSENAGKLGQLLAKKALGKKVKQVVFDRGGYAYQGRLKVFAEAARSGGLAF